MIIRHDTAGGVSCMQRTPVINGVVVLGFNFLPPERYTLRERWYSSGIHSRIRCVRFAGVVPLLYCAGAFQIRRVCWNRPGCCVQDGTPT